MQLVSFKRLKLYWLWATTVTWTEQVGPAAEPNLFLSSIIINIVAIDVHDSVSDAFKLYFSWFHVFVNVQNVIFCTIAKFSLESMQLTSSDENRLLSPGGSWVISAVTGPFHTKQTDTKLKVFSVAQTNWVRPELALKMRKVTNNDQGKQLCSLSSI